MTSGFLWAKKKPAITAFYILLNSRDKASSIMLYWLHGYGTKRRSLKSFFSFWWETLWVSAYLLYAFWIMQIGRNGKESPWASSRTLKHSRSTSSWNPLRMEYGFVHKWPNPRATVNSSLALESLKHNLEMRVYLPDHSMTESPISSSPLYIHPHDAPSLSLHLPLDHTVTDW